MHKKQIFQSLRESIERGEIHIPDLRPRKSPVQYFSSHDKAVGPDRSCTIRGIKIGEKLVVTSIKRGTEPLEYLQRPSLRFNWGFWDAAALTARGVARQDGIGADNIIGSHFDPFYAHGFVAGCAVVKGQGLDGRSSSRAWQDFLAGLTDPDMIFQVEANP